MELETLLRCPRCQGGFIDLGKLFRCVVCATEFPIVNGIWRFVPSENYAGSFGLQWNRFARTQIDSQIGTNRSETRFREETDWDETNLRNTTVLDAGCGAGRFSEVALKFGAQLLAVDYSSAVESAQLNLKFGNNLVIQADLAKLPILSNSIDFIYCIGVLQHTSHPEVIISELARCLKLNGELTLTFYENSSWHVKFYSKYIIRPITKRLPKSLLLTSISQSSRVWFPVTKFLFSLPYPLSRFCRFLIPVANYVEYKYLDPQDAIDEAILDTFDMLSPAFDQPIKKANVVKWVNESGFFLEPLKQKKLKGLCALEKLARST